MDRDELRQIIEEVIDEQLGVAPAEIAKKWIGGQVILQPDDDSQPKEIPIEVFFKKIVTVRDSLRVLEQKLNNHSELDAADKANLQSYITKAYGTLTTFNVLFARGGDRFKGSGGVKTKEKLTMSEAKKKLGLNEY